MVRILAKADKGSEEGGWSRLGGWYSCWREELVPVDWFESDDDWRKLLRLKL
jgi:hypothetical protein